MCRVLYSLGPHYLHPHDLTHRPRDCLAEPSHDAAEDLRTSEGVMDVRPHTTALVWVESPLEHP